MGVIQNDKGFTLVEVILTMALIGILSVSVLSLYQHTVRNQRVVQDRTAAILFAQQDMERIGAEKYLHGYNYIINQNFPAQISNRIRRTVVIQELDPRLKKVTTIVELDGRLDSLVTYQGNYQ
jgi:prepilin-type N-terminal cleavage/methylation domain-containing protein